MLTGRCTGTITPAPGGRRSAQINAGNVARLRRAWTYGLQSDTPSSGGGAAGPNSEATPIVVNGTMYVPAANRVVALDPQTGQERLAVRRHGRRAVTARRRVLARRRQRCRREFSSPPGRRLIALNATTGALDSRFGTNGEVDMVVPYNSVPLVYRNIVVVGANTPPGAIGGIGNPRAFDARTGAKVWEFNSVPQPGEVGHDTWEGDSWKNRLGANAWPFYFTLDEQRGLLYVPLASPIVGAYGGDRKGANLFGNSVVAVDIQTGKYKWHFQTIHHDLVGRGSAGAARTLRHHPKRTHDSRARRHDEVWLPVHSESRNRRADFRRRGTAGAEERRSW